MVEAKRDAIKAAALQSARAELTEEHEAAIAAMAEQHAAAIAELHAEYAAKVEVASAAAIPVETHQPPPRAERAKTMTQFSALIVRQLLSRYTLDGKDAVSRIGAHCARDGSVREFVTCFNMPRTSDARAHAAAILQFFGRASLTDAEMDASIGSLLRMPAAAVEATPVVHLKGFLSDAEMQAVVECAAARARLDGKSGPSGPTRSPRRASDFPHDVQYGSNHVALNLHRDGFFASRCPALDHKITCAMRTQPGMFLTEQIALSVRCCEWHTYTPGDGLATRGHRDQGSVVTMSMLLSRPGEGADFEGGSFLTCDRAAAGDNGDGTHVSHPILRGDALLFHSEKMHNVAAITRGIRHALVVELWLKKANAHDRHT